MRNAAEYLRGTVDLVKQIETRFTELGARLYRIREERLYADSHDSFQGFLDEIGVKKAIASVLCSVHRAYVVDGGVKRETLAGIGYTNLYKAIPLIGSGGVERAVATARTLSRDDIEDEVREERHGVHEHVAGAERWGVCACGKFVRVNEAK